MFHVLVTNLYLLFEVSVQTICLFLNWVFAFVIIFWVMYRLEFGPSTAFSENWSPYNSDSDICSHYYYFFPFKFQDQQKYPSYLPSLKPTVLMFSIFVLSLFYIYHAPLILFLCPSHLSYFQNILLYDPFLLLMLKYLYLVSKRKLIFDSCLNHYLPASHHCYASLKMFFIFCLLLPHLFNPDSVFIIVLKVILE